MRIYIAGPMTGLPDFNYPAFHEAAQRLRSLGHHVENPAENPVPPCKSWRGYMRLAIRQLVTCDCAALLPGWEYSQGARAERRIANDLDLPAFPLEEVVQLLQSASAEVLRARLATGAWPPGDPYREHLADQAEAIDMSRLATYLARMGIAAPEGGLEHLAARFGEMVNAITLYRVEPEGASA